MVYLSGQNMSLLKNSIEFNNGDVNANDNSNKEASSSKKPNPKNHEIDSAVFVQTNKADRTSKIPNLKIEIGKNLSNLVVMGRLIRDVKTNFESIDKALNIESESQVKLPNERKEFIDKNVLEIETVLNETEIDGKKIFLSSFKMNVQVGIASSEVYKARIDFADSFSGFDLDFNGVEDNLDKRFNQIREVNKSLSTIDVVSEEVETHTKVLKKEMDKFISAGKDSMLIHLNSKLDESSLVNNMKLKAELFTDPKNLALTQINANSSSVLNLLP